MPLVVCISSSGVTPPCRMRNPPADCAQEQRSTASWKRTWPRTWLPQARQERSFSLRAPQAEAEVVYTPAHVKLAGGSTYQVDLNHDGINDFGLEWLPIYHSSMLLATLDATGNQVVATAKGSDEAAAMPMGIPVGPNRKFASKTTYGGVFMALSGGYGSQTWFNGPWANAVRKYLGLKFLIDGEVHYGWARLTVTHTGAILTGYAYETIANKPIPAGRESGQDEQAATDPAELAEPMSRMATLGMLARGADGVDLWRREEEAA